MEDNYDNHPLDLSYLVEMVGHDPEFMIEIFETFIEQTPFYVAELEDALYLKNLKKVADCAHKIKPTFTYVGRTDVREFVHTIERSARELVELDTLPQRLKQLHQMLETIYIQIERSISEVRTKYNMS
ncbi:MULTISPECIES: Hpt domain-containing protein [unclassified Pedobacter]|uniref:Hpt domain-containing protein n=1 Tax=unclassified Pedobacter TaxID=2628915 RepID=UPI001E344E8C|nr:MULTISPECIES: Hpt domain-containing protein [unclassified Pedobacter]